MGAEAPAAHADGVLVAEDGGDEAVVDAVERERDDPDPVDVDVGRTVEAQPGHRGEARRIA